MEVIVAFVVWFFRAISSIGFFPSDWSLSDWSLSPRPASIFTELGSSLSPNASTILPSSARFKDAAMRWCKYRTPNIHVIVEVSYQAGYPGNGTFNQFHICKAELVIKILYANRHNLPFLAKSGAIKKTKKTERTQYNANAIAEREDSETEDDEEGSGGDYEEAEDDGEKDEEE